MALCGYIWAILAIAITGYGFFNISYFESIMSNQIEVSKNWTGGNIIEVKRYKNYSVIIHEQVEQGQNLFGESNFVQVDFCYELAPRVLDEQIDYNEDGIDDFKIVIDNAKQSYIFEDLSNKDLRVSKEGMLIYEHAKKIRILVSKRIEE